MILDLQAILKSKRVLRRELAERPVAEKLRMLDALGEGALAIRSAKPTPGTGVLPTKSPASPPVGQP